MKKSQDILKIIKGKSIGFLGISFKPNTDDTRDAPSIIIMDNLVNLGAKVKAYDPIVKIPPETLNTKVMVCDNVENIFEDSDLIILVTEWDEFKNLDYKKLGDLMCDKNIIDGRNFLTRNELQDAGYKYVGIGR